MTQPSNFPSPRNSDCVSQGSHMTAAATLPPATAKPMSAKEISTSVVFWTPSSLRRPLMAAALMVFFPLTATCCPSRSFQLLMEGATSTATERMFRIAEIVLAPTGTTALWDEPTLGRVKNRHGAHVGAYIYRAGRHRLNDRGAQIDTLSLRIGRRAASQIPAPA